MKVAIYARISDPGYDANEVERKKRQDTDNQVVPLRELVIARGWELYKIYVDEVSAVKKRPQFDAMMQDAFEGKFGTLVVVKIDRVARSVQDFIRFLQKMKDYNIRFLATTQGIDTQESNAAANLLLNMLAAVAQFEREIISERVKAGLDRRRREGKHVGRAPVIFDMRKALDLHKGDILENRPPMSWRTVAKKLGIKKSTLIERMRKYYE